MRHRNKDEERKEFPVWDLWRLTLWDCWDPSLITSPDLSITSSMVCSLSTASGRARQACVCLCVRKWRACAAACVRELAAFKHRDTHTASPNTGKCVFTSSRPSKNSTQDRFLNESQMTVFSHMILNRFAPTPTLLLSAQRCFKWKNLG